MSRQVYEQNIQALILEKYPHIAAQSDATKAMIIDQLWWVQESKQFTPQADVLYNAAQSQWGQHIHREIFRALSSIEMLLLLRQTDSDNLHQNYSQFVYFQPDTDEIGLVAFAKLVKRFSALPSEEVDAQIRARLIAAVTLSPKAKELATERLGKFPIDSVQFSGVTVSLVGDLYPVYASASSLQQLLMRDCFPNDIRHWRHAFFIENANCLAPLVNESYDMFDAVAVAHWLDYWLINSFGFEGHVGSLEGAKFLTGSVYQRAVALEKSIMSLSDQCDVNPLKAYASHCLSVLGVKNISEDKAMFVARLVNMANVFSPESATAIVGMLNGMPESGEIVARHAQMMRLPVAVTYLPGFLQNVLQASSSSQAIENLVVAMDWVSKTAMSHAAQLQHPLSLRLMNKEVVTSLLDTKFQLFSKINDNGELTGDLVTPTLRGMCMWRAQQKGQHANAERDHHLPSQRY